MTPEQLIDECECAIAFEGGSAEVHIVHTERQKGYRWRFMHDDPNSPIGEIVTVTADDSGWVVAYDPKELLAYVESQRIKREEDTE